jgi:hypothetical protein
MRLWNYTVLGPTVPGSIKMATHSKQHFDICLGSIEFSFIYSAAKRFGTQWHWGVGFRRVDLVICTRYSRVVPAIFRTVIVKTSGTYPLLSKGRYGLGS